MGTLEPRLAIRVVNVHSHSAPQKPELHSPHHYKTTRDILFFLKNPLADFRPADSIGSGLPPHQLWVWCTTSLLIKVVSAGHPLDCVFFCLIVCHLLFSLACPALLGLS